MHWLNTHPTLLLINSSPLFLPVFNPGIIFCRVSGMRFLLRVKTSIMYFAGSSRKCLPHFWIRALSPSLSRMILMGRLFASCTTRMRVPVDFAASVLRLRLIGHFSRKRRSGRCCAHLGSARWQQMRRFIMMRIGLMVMRPTEIDPRIHSEHILPAI